MNTSRFAGLLLVLGFLSSGDLVRQHTHLDGAPASSDCAACVAGLHAPMAAEPLAPQGAPPVTTATRSALEAGAAPSLPFVRRGGLRDPPSALA